MQKMQKITTVERNGVDCWCLPLPDGSTIIPGLKRNISETEIKQRLIAAWVARGHTLSEADIVIESQQQSRDAGKRNPNTATSPSKNKEASPVYVAPELSRQPPKKVLKAKPRADVPAVLETVEEPVPPIDLPEIELVAITPAKSPWPVVLSSYTYADAKEEEDKGVREAFELYSILDSLGDQDSAARTAFLKHVGYLLSYVKELRREKAA
jgi:hypothetical protein